MFLALSSSLYFASNRQKGVGCMNYEKMWTDLLEKLKFECEKVNGFNGTTKEDHIKFNAFYSIVKLMEDMEGIERK